MNLKKSRFEDPSVLAFECRSASPSLFEISIKRIVNIGKMINT
jgi:hypothetical protein